MLPFLHQQERFSCKGGKCAKPTTEASHDQEARRHGYTIS